MDKLHPTLWRTCRVLGNRLRLRMLAELLLRPDQSVSGLARRLELPLPVASRYLRELNARGLLRVRREGSRVYYRPGADRSVWNAAPLLAALERAFADEAEPIELVYRAVTAFTQPRRILIVKALGSSEQTMAALRMKTRMCHRVLARHLRKLESRGFVRIEGNRCRCARPESPFPATLLELVLRD